MSWAESFFKCRSSGLHFYCYLRVLLDRPPFTGHYWMKPVGSLPDGLVHFFSRQRQCVPSMFSMALPSFSHLRSDFFCCSDDVWRGKLRPLAQRKNLDLIRRSTCEILFFEDDILWMWSCLLPLI